MTEDTSEETAGETVDEHDIVVLETEMSEFDAHCASVCTNTDDPVEDAGSDTDGDIEGAEMASGSSVKWSGWAFTFGVET